MVQKIEHQASVDFRAKMLEQDRKDEQLIDVFTGACALIVIFLVTYEFWRFVA